MRFLRPLVAVLTLLAAAPLAADTVVTVKAHTDAAGKRQPAKDEIQTYWFGDQAMRYDLGETSMILRIDRSKMYMVNHADRSFAEVDLPFDYKAALGAAGPMMERMFEMMKPTVKVAKSDKKGSFAGYDCTYVNVEITMGMGNMKTSTDSCISDEVPVDYARYAKFAQAQAEMLPSSEWMKEMTEAIQGFPVRSDSTSTAMGKTFTSWTELQSVEEKAAPAGTYEAPEGYKKNEFNPMAQMQQGR